MLYTWNQYKIMLNVNCSKKKKDPVDLGADNKTDMIPHLAKLPVLPEETVDNPQMDKMNE